MIYSSLAVLALSASAIITPASNTMNAHPKSAAPDTRINIVLHNTAVGFRDVRIGGQLYTVQPHKSLSVKAPVGTPIIAVSRTRTPHPGGEIVEITPQLANHTVDID
jgi:hypothetical protein